jgi:hypothetical protein
MYINNNNMNAVVVVSLYNSAYTHITTTPHNNKTTTMSLASVFPDILCLTDSFWSDSTLDVLRMLMSTSKGIRAVLLVERAILAMMQTRPLVMKISDAKYRFSLQLNAMVRHCAALPVGDSCRIDEVCSGRYTIQEYVTQLNRGNFRGCSKIRFIDAYRLLVSSSSSSANGNNNNNRIKAAMERRHLFDVDVLASVVSLVRMVGDRYERMEENVTNAIFKLYDGLGEDEGKKKVVGKNTLLHRIHQLEELSNDLVSAIFHMKDSFSVDRVAIIPIPKTKANVHDYSRLFPTLVNRYRLHSAKCPELMTMDCCCLGQMLCSADP